MIGKYTMSPERVRATMRNGRPERKRGGNDMRMPYEGDERIVRSICSSGICAKAEIAEKWQFQAMGQKTGYRQKNVSGYAINHQFKYGNSSF